MGTIVSYEFCKSQCKASFFSMFCHLLVDIICEIFSTGWTTYMNICGIHIHACDHRRSMWKKKLLKVWLYIIVVDDEVLFTMSSAKLPRFVERVRVRSFAIVHLCRSVVDSMTPMSRLISSANAKNSMSLTLSSNWNSKILRMSNNLRRTRMRQNLIWPLIVIFSSNYFHFIWWFRNH